jgi:putative IMPACT (imprinted ancient) family translation regulator
VKDINVDTTENAIQMKVGRSPPIEYEGNNFSGSKVSIQTPDDIIPALHAIYADTRIARASHNTYAYRLVSTTGSVVEHYEDDGEFGAGRRLLNLLKDNYIENTLVCATRWYGGKHIGPVRFDKIIQCASRVLNI